MKLNVDTILKKLATEVPLGEPNWEKERELFLKRPVFLKKAQLKDKGSKKKTSNRSVV